jgi:hypothetical protein
MTPGSDVLLKMPLRPRIRGLHQGGSDCPLLSGVTKRDCRRGLARLWTEPRRGDVLRNPGVSGLERKPARRDNLCILDADSSTLFFAHPPKVLIRHSHWIEMPQLISAVVVYSTQRGLDACLCLVIPAPSGCSRIVDKCRIKPQSQFVTCLPTTDSNSCLSQAKEKQEVAGAYCTY